MRKLLAGVAASTLLFVLGVVVGESLDDSPRPGGTQTLVRTLRPLPLAPAARTTVTVTVQNP